MYGSSVLSATSMLLNFLTGKSTGCPMIRYAGLTERIHHPRDRRMLAVLDLHPVLRPASLIRTVPSLRHQAFKAETCIHCEKFPEKFRVCLNELLRDSIDNL